MKSAARRFLRFRLRTLFTLITLLCVWLGLQVSIVNERKRLREWMALEGHKPHIDFPIFPEKSMSTREHLNAVRMWLGDQPTDRIMLCKKITEEEKKRLERAFPNSIVDDTWIDWIQYMQQTRPRPRFHLYAN